MSLTTPHHLSDNKYLKLAYVFADHELIVFCDGVVEDVCHGGGGGVLGLRDPGLDAGGGEDGAER